ncbi:hypothetical protein H7U19_07755 [Hyunsoonleella sp. SJ7]|uniref:Uncharacterized protein n=1 Tax=Hyunsoonleella aquatilis TaxID=2762758 RepID=A0A923HBL1_9FLAO|nr:hypothetical protein [Hyunsoonleella aquatilis]MBC3758294.1 hypothetical protein [Hyunsoonleella aquatilis]
MGNEIVIFRNKLYRILLITVLILLSAWNGYALMEGNSRALIPLLVQISLIVLIVIENKFVKQGLQVWGIILIFGNGISLLMKVLMALIEGQIEFSNIVKNTLFLGVGILVYILSRKHIDIIKNDRTDKI